MALFDLMADGSMGGNATAPTTTQSAPTFDWNKLLSMAAQYGSQQQQTVMQPIMPVGKQQNLMQMPQKDDGKDMKDINDIVSILSAWFGAGAGAVGTGGGGSYG